MKTNIGLLFLLLGGVGMIACVAVVAGIWIVRPMLLQVSEQGMDSADEALTLVEEKSARADALVKRVRVSVDPIAGKILKLADKAGRTPAEDEELKRIEAEVAERLAQLDMIAATLESAIDVMDKASRLTRSLKSKDAAAPEQESPGRGAELARLAEKLKVLRASVARVREDKEVRNEVADELVQRTREVSDALQAVDAKLQEVNRKSAVWRADIAELRTAIPMWINVGAIVLTAIVVWLGLGQFALSRWGLGLLKPTTQGA